MKKLKKYLLYIWALIILALTTFPVPEYEGTIEKYYDKIAHLFLFGILAYLIYGNIFTQFSRWKTVSISFFISLLIIKRRRNEKQFPNQDKS